MRENSHLFQLRHQWKFNVSARDFCQSIFSQSAMFTSKFGNCPSRSYRTFILLNISLKTNKKFMKTELNYSLNVKISLN